MTDLPSAGLLRNPPADLRVEIAVIGSGPGGSVTACLLAEAGRDVLLLEEGPFLPLGSCRPFSLEEMVQKYRNGGVTVALGPTKVSYVEGRCAGGGSEINSGFYHRTPASVLEQWREEYRVEALREGDLLPHFEASERELNVARVPVVSPASLKLYEGARRLGWKSLEVPRWLRYEPAGGPDGGLRWTRQSMTQTYLPRALQAGGRLLSDTRALRLRPRGQGWSILAEHAPAGEPRRTLRIDAETVFVCAGAIQTPALLRRSGLRQNVGNSLRMHPTVKVVARFPEAVNTEDTNIPVHQVKEFAPQFSFGGSVSSPPYLALAMNDHPGHARAVAENWRQMAVYYAMVAGSGQGTIRCLPFFRDPVVRYRLTPSDWAMLAEGLRQLCRLLFQAGAVALYPSIRQGPCWTAESQLAELLDVMTPERTSLMTIHLFSSCPMGEERRLCAADSFGQVHGVPGLYLGDASLLCTPPSVNPQGTIMALARRNALKFLGRL